MTNFIGEESFFKFVYLDLLQMTSAESLAFGRGITRKLQGFGRNRNIFVARR